MSSHQIYIKCPVDDCPEIESIYTGGVTTDRFPDSGWEGEFIYTKCNSCIDAEDSRQAEDAEREGS